MRVDRIYTVCNRISLAYKTIRTHCGPNFQLQLTKMILFCNQALRSKKAIDIPKRVEKPILSGTNRIKYYKLKQHCL